MPPGFISAICAPARLGVGELRVGDDVTERALAVGPAVADDVGGDRADDPVGDRRDRGAVLVGDRLGGRVDQCRVRHEDAGARSVCQVPSALRTPFSTITLCAAIVGEPAGAAVQRVVDVGDQLAVAAGAGDDRRAPGEFGSVHE